MNTIDKIEKRIEMVFGKIQLNSISSIMDNRIRIENYQRNTNDIQLSYKNSAKVLEAIYEGKEVWLRVILWEHDSFDNLLKCGFTSSDFVVILEREVGFNELTVAVKYLQLQEFRIESLSPFIKAVINFDLGINPMSNITCFYLNFDVPALVNIYDDRGIDVLTPNEKIKRKIRLATSG